MQEDHIETEIFSRLHSSPEWARRVLNHGLIELEDAWGDETTIINTARISTTNRRVSKETWSNRDFDLLCELLKNQHGTPFETVYFRYRFIAPIFVLRQWVKHRISSWNEFSMRYRTPIQQFYKPDQDAITIDGYAVLDDEDLASYTALMEQVMEWQDAYYQKVCARIDANRASGVLPEKAGGRDPYRGRARELLRNVVPVAAYSDVYWTVNLRSLMNFFHLRRKENAQYEMRLYADAAYALFLSKFPVLAQAISAVEAAG